MPSIGFGLERLGLPAIRHPVIALMIAVVFSVVCAVGLTRIKTEQTLSELFRSGTPEFANYTQLTDRFPTSEHDVLVLVEGQTLMRPVILEQIRDLHAQLESAEVVDGVLSIFSVRDPGDSQSLPAPVLPPELPEGKAFDALMTRVLAHPLIGGQLMSKPDEDSQFTLLIASLRPETSRTKGLFEPLREIKAITRKIIEPAGLSAQFAGVPVMQVEIDEAMLRDRIIFNGSGFLVGMVIALAFFRRFKFVLITSICPALAVLWAIGLIGWFDLKLNIFINVIPPLVMVITFTDSMHMVFSIRRRLKDGVDRLTAVRHAILSVGPACVLTSLTTSIAFLSLTFVDSALIRTFGIAAALATLLAFLTVIVVLPPLVVLIFRNEAKFIAGENRHYHAIAWLERLCSRLAEWVGVGYRSIASIGILLIITFAALHLQLEPGFRLSDEVPDSKQSVAAANRIDEKLAGAHPIHIMLRWPQGEDVVSARVTGLISETHKLLKEHAEIGNVWSLDTLRGWLPDTVEKSGATLRRYLDNLPAHLLGRFVNENARTALLTGHLPDLDTKDTVPIVRELESRLDRLREKNPAFEFTVSGLTALSASQSPSIISQLNRGLLGAIGVVIVLIGVAFRSASTAVISILPNLFPIVTAGAAISLTGGGLEYASIIAMTVAFGIAVDDTIHFLNRLHIETDHTGSLRMAIHQTISRIGPVLILTTLILVLGLAVTMLSELPTMRLFGALFMTTLMAALVADLVFLPPIILAARKLLTVRKPPSPLMGKTLRESIVGKTIYLRTEEGVELPIAILPSGYMRRRVNSSAATTTNGPAQSDRGVWWIKEDRLYQRWGNWLNGKTHSYTLKCRGKVLFWDRDDGCSGTARYGD